MNTEAIITFLWQAKWVLVAYFVINLILTGLHLWILFEYKNKTFILNAKGLLCRYKRLFVFPEEFITFVLMPLLGFFMVICAVVSDRRYTKRMKGPEFERGDPG